MSIGYLLGGMFCIIYAVLVAYFGGIKKNVWLLKMVKMKLSKKMSDNTAAKISLGFGLVIGAVGVFLLIFGAIQG